MQISEEREGGTFQEGETGHEGNKLWHPVLLLVGEVVQRLHHCRQHTQNLREYSQRQRIATWLGCLEESTADPPPELPGMI